MIRSAFTIVGIVFLLAGCGTSNDKNNSGNSRGSKEESDKKLPEVSFSADSAYQYVKKQLSFGPRVPNTPGHKQAARWLTQKLRNYADTVRVQKGEVEAYNGKTLFIKNIRASFNPDADKQLLLGAHWDTRPFADRDTTRTQEPIPGANDGGSGTAVLLEVARQLHENNPDVGINIILFDAEDYGAPEAQQKRGKDNKFCLGSAYWAKRIKEDKYWADYGILLDMVGAKNATFLREGYSLKQAPRVVDKIWSVAHQLGHGSLFSYTKTRPVMDDHVNVTRKAGIPMANIIDYNHRRPNGFGDYWHTHDDDLSLISRKTLKAVGETVLTVIREESMYSASR